MGVYFGISLLKNETNYGYNTAKLGEQDIFLLDGQFSECSEFLGWRSDLSIYDSPNKYYGPIAVPEMYRPIIPIPGVGRGWHVNEYGSIEHDDSRLIDFSIEYPPGLVDFPPGIPFPKLTHSQTDCIYLVLARCLRDGLAPSMITKPKDQQSEMIRSYERIRLHEDVFWDVLVFEAQKDDMFCYIEPNDLTLYLVSENDVKSFTSKTYDNLRERVLSDRTMQLSEKVKNSLNSFGPRHWCPVYPE